MIIQGFVWQRRSNPKPYINPRFNNDPPKIPHEVPGTQRVSQPKVPQYSRHYSLILLKFLGAYPA